MAGNSATPKAAFDAGLLDFLDRSPTPFHAVANLRAALQDAGFTEYAETDAWQIAPRTRGFVVRNDSSIVAFALGRDDPVTGGLRMVGAHTDSPCLKLKPNAAQETVGYRKLGVEVYGGVLLNPWFDRDLSLAGRLTLRERSGALRNLLVDFAAPIAIIPSLAIHLDREANEGRSVNKQTMLPPVVGLAGGGEFTLQSLLAHVLPKRERKLAGATVLDFELSFYDTQKAAMVGLEREFIASARLDNLLSCYTGLRALLAAGGEHGVVLVCNDHEEVGSGSAAGARGNFLRSVLLRLAGSEEACARMLAASVLVSTDNAHGIHPNFADKHDSRHGPVLNQGPVLKFNSNQSYATNSITAGLLRHAAERGGVALQSFVTRTDMGCGSTIGPLTAAQLGVRTVDIGVPTFAMHSIRELAGSADAHALYRLLLAFFALDSLRVD